MTGLPPESQWPPFFFPRPLRPTPQPASFIEKVNATRELIQVVNDLRGELTFSIELVDAHSGAVLRIDTQTAPAQVMEFCQQAQEAAP